MRKFMILCAGLASIATGSAALAMIPPGLSELMTYYDFHGNIVGQVWMTCDGTLGGWGTPSEYSLIENGDC